jgi:hypothetical protein
MRHGDRYCIAITCPLTFLHLAIAQDHPNTRYTNPHPHHYPTFATLGPRKYKKNGYYIGKYSQNLKPQRLVLSRYVSVDCPIACYSSVLLPNPTPQVPALPEP